MKKLILPAMITALLAHGQLLSQAPESISYQAVARNDLGHALVSQNVSFRFNLLQGSTSGSAVYVETHTTTTNGLGLVNLNIGNGTVVSGVFADIDWSDGPYFLKVELDPDGGSSYLIMGTSQLLSVPYALHAESASALGTGTEGQIQFGKAGGGGLDEHEDLFWDNSQKFLGVGTDEPHLPLTVNGHMGIAYNAFDPATKVGFGALQANGSSLIYWDADGISHELTLGNGIYSGSGTTPANTEVTLANTLHFDDSTFVIDGGNHKLGIGTSTTQSKVTIEHGTNGEPALTVKSNNVNAGGVGLVEIMGKREDTNSSGTFSGTLALSHNRTSSAHSNTFHGISGRILFGGNHTDGDESNILYPASIAGVSEGTYSNATTMPTGIAFYTGSSGVSPGTANVYAGTERMRITNEGNIGVGTDDPSAKLHVNGPISRNAPTIVSTQTYTVSSTDNWVILTYSSGNITLTLPAAADWTGRELMILNRTTRQVNSVASNVVNESGSTSFTILPSTSGNTGACCTLVSDGSDWIVVQWSVP